LIIWGLSKQNVVGLACKRRIKYFKFSGHSYLCMNLKFILGSSIEIKYTIHFRTLKYNAIHRRPFSRMNLWKEEESHIHHISWKNGIQITDIFICNYPKLSRSEKIKYFILFITKCAYKRFSKYLEHTKERYRIKNKFEIIFFYII
jgi:hypothetical protein